MCVLGSARHKDSLSYLSVQAGSHEGAVGGVGAFARAQQVSRQAACQLHLMLDVAVIVEIPEEAIPAQLPASAPSRPGQP